MVAMRRCMLGFTTLCASLASAELQEGDACSTTVRMPDNPPEACADGLICILTDAGFEAADVPNAGICLQPGSALPVGHDCTASSTPCVTGLDCRPEGVPEEAASASEGICQKCPCGETCTMLGGGSGSCGADDKTCANWFTAVECPESDPLPGVPEPPTEEQLELQLGDVCKSGGVETGPGVQREYDCPVGSVCLPQPDVMAIGGEVPFTCQTVSGDLPENGICSTSGSMIAPPTTCQVNLECTLTVAGRPELDVPNAGVCLPLGLWLAVDSVCSQMEGATPCAPTLHCQWIHGAAPPETNAPADGYRCQGSEGGMPPPMQPGEGTDADMTEDEGLQAPTGSSSSQSSLQLALTAAAALASTLSAV